MLVDNCDRCNIYIKKPKMITENILTEGAGSTIIVAALHEHWQVRCVLVDDCEIRCDISYHLK